LAASTSEFEFEAPVFPEKQRENKASIETTVQCLPPGAYITFVYGVSISITPCQPNRLLDRLKEGKSVFCSPVACSAVQDVGV
jgi:hypothetical protein